MARPDLTVEEELEVFCKGASEVIDKESLKERIVSARSEKRPLIVKLGADPSAPDIHLGHSVVLWKLHELQEIGHEICFLIGDFTGRIGDPTGKSETRKPLSSKEVAQNAETYKKQIFKILSPEKTRIVFNSQWLAPLKFEDVIHLAAKYTVARMLERDDFEKRYREGRAISVHEFFYPLCQGYDSVALSADIELGGTDQKFNILVGRELQRSYGQAPQICILMPILEGTDGVQKMSKSLGNYIGINEEPKDIFGKVMSISDEMMYRYYLLLTPKSKSEVDQLLEDVNTSKRHPMEVKKELARTLVDIYHGSGKGEQAQWEFEKVFSKKENPSDMLSLDLSQFPAKMMASKLFCKAFSISGGESKRLLKGGAGKVDGEKVSDPKASVSLRSGMVLQLGKRRFARFGEE